MNVPESPAGDPTPATPPSRASEAEAAVREPGRQLQLISENFPAGALYQYVVTADGRRLLTYLGRGFERIFGELPPQLPVDVAWLSARIHSADEPGMAEAGMRSHRDLSPFQHEVRIRRADGTERWVSFRSQPRALSDQSVVWDGAIIDVTERRRAEDSDRRQVEFLAALNQTTLELLARRSVADLLQALVERASVLLKSPHAEISLLEGDALVVRAFSKGRDYLIGDRVGRNEPAISWHAIDTGLPVVTDQYSASPDSRAIYRERGVQVVAVFPIMRGTECVGVLGLAREQPDTPLSVTDLHEGTLLAQMAALVLQNAATYEEAVREAEARNVALRESEEHFRGVFDQSPIAIGLLSLPQGSIIEFNPAALAAFGYARDEVVGRTSVDLKLWVDPDRRDQYIQQLRAQGSVKDFEAEMRRKNGETFTVLHSGTLVTFGGQPYSLNSIQDISARKQSEAARDCSLALMRATLESTADAILVVNAGGRIDTYNRNFAAMWRLPDDPDDRPDDASLLRTILDQLVAPEEFLASINERHAQSERGVFDVLYCRDGRVLERSCRPQILRDRPVGRVWSFRDITKRRRAEAALRESEERFRALAELSPVGIFSSDPAGQCIFVNQRWCEIAGLTPAQALGAGWTTALHPDDRNRVASAWAEAVRRGESSAAEFRFVRPDGGVTWLVGQSRAHFQADGTLAGYVGTITDVTNLKRAEEERTKVEAQMRQSRKLESLGTLAGGIAHEFNNILNGTFGFVDLARLELPPGHSVHAWLDRIAASSQRARELVCQVLTFSRKTEGERVPLRLHVVVGEALRLLRSTLPATVELEARLQPETPPARADVTQIHQVVLNLCTNAWHALAPGGGRIVVTLEPWTVTAGQGAAQPDLRAGLCARLTVADNGSGMDAAMLEHIFEPLFTTKDVGSGAGLGLAVVHGIVKSHEGAIVVRSEVGAGTTFELYFPAVAAEPVPPVPPPPEVPRGNGERILVVDDDTVSGFVTEKMAESLGYTVTRCTRPEEARARFTAAPSAFDLVVSDLAMPGMTGEELIEHLVRIRPDIPIVVATGYVETVRQRILERGAARAVLRKPVSRDELAQALAQSLRGSR
ncbi:MAG: PAS domain S-box protein [Verrucomicrobia bacterium]|nr:PAS domain S-box protein [Verrucomicrobiota bacterium]